jgi:predicted type IV restriction endonuclease
MSNNQYIISDLVEKFKRNFDEYKNPKFNEAQVRIEFVNPFWKALGWDVDNDKGYSFAYRDVIHEDEVKVGRTTRAPDYSFRIGGTSIFYIPTQKLQSQIDTTDRQIDQLVYQLYGLTEKETQIVEEAAG